MSERRVGVAVDFSACSIKALKWTVDNVIRDEDHLILITVLPEGSYEGAGESQFWAVTGGSPFIPLSELLESDISKKYGVKPDAETLDIVTTLTNQKKVQVLLKVYWGDPREKICEAIDKIPLSSLVIGNRGLGKIKRVILGSVSNYVVNNGTCPVTVAVNVVIPLLRLPSFVFMSGVSTTLPVIRSGLKIILVSLETSSTECFEIEAA
ncbi:hypothetical protein ACFE04_014645 [Oxalis oulophora]